MKGKSNILLTLAALVMVGACSKIPPEAYANRNAESLLDVSSELVTLRLDSPESLDEITDWINQDQPSRAELYCMENDSICMQAQEVLEQFGVAVDYYPAADNETLLVYERILARDCDSSFISNHVNPYNLNHPTFGCSVAANTVQMVSDKQQFVYPELTGERDAEKAAQTHREYAKPSKDTSTELKTLIKQ